ncbi:retinaldehyde-binding protein 1 isoform X1 [Nilaparvata lugens]|uniref:retinaldehyde-binding protein 1 isoform X1 n=2 Tax=Nilaparvata lugens TaxID=108931 RepID=UPI00193CFC83|nr:retinaldehyde-binding protein 1 isoform X1 [Nilaparvata lugens]
MCTKTMLIRVPGESESHTSAPQMEQIDRRFRLENEPITADTKLIAERELRETDERANQAINELRTMLREQHKLYFDDSDEMLRVFLRPTKYYPDSAMELMKRVADFKEKHIELLRNLSAESDKKALVENKVVNVLVNRDQKGRRVLVVNIGKNWDVKKVKSEQLFRLFYLIHLAAMMEPETQVRGVVVLLDFEGLSLSQAWAMDLTFSSRLLTFIQSAMPLRLKEVHIVREPGVFKLVWGIFQSFVNQKLSARLHRHGSNFKALHEFIDPAHLPADYGGSLPKIDYSSKDWYPTLCTIDSHIKAWMNYGNVKTE